MSAPLERIVHTDSGEETIQFGRALAAEIPRPSLILLTGDLGAGKTTLAKGIIHGLGAAEIDEVTSPTFTLIHEYSGSVFHIDLYRLETWKEVESLGLDDLFSGDSIVLIEWGERFPELAEQASIQIALKASGDRREIRISPAPRGRNTSPE